MKKLTEKEIIIHRQFANYGRNAREWLRKCALLLPHIEHTRIWEKKGFSSIFEYAAKIAGMSRSSVEEALRVLKKIEDKPELQKIVELQGVQKVRPIAAIATTETAVFWAEKARTMSKNALETYVREYRLSFLPGEKIQGMKTNAQTLFAPKNDEADAGTTNKAGAQWQKQPDASSITITLDPAIARKFLELKGNKTWNEFIKDLVETKVAAMKKPEPVATNSRHIPVKIKKYVLAKAKGHCSYPGCTKQHQILHHTQRFALEHVHDPDRIAPLCFSHERIAHLGLIDHEEKNPHEWKLRKMHDPTDPKFEIDRLVSARRLQVNTT